MAHTSHCLHADVMHNKGGESYPKPIAELILSIIHICKSCHIPAAKEPSENSGSQYTLPVLIHALL